LRITPAPRCRKVIVAIRQKTSARSEYFASWHIASFRCDAEFSPSALSKLNRKSFLSSQHQQAIGHGAHRDRSHGVHREMSTMHAMLLFATVARRKHKGPKERTQVNEQKNSFNFRIRRSVVLCQRQRPGRGRLRPRRTSWRRWSLLRQRRRGRGARCGRCCCTGRRGLRSGTSLAPAAAPLLGLLSPLPALSKWVICQAANHPFACPAAAMKTDHAAGVRFLPRDGGRSLAKDASRKSRNTRNRGLRFRRPS
jgi:hypothetical protein